MVLGRKVLIEGNRNKIANVITIVMKKGKDPLKTSSTVLPVTPLSTYTFMPTGGVMRDISPVTTCRTPKYRGSNPRFSIIGKTMGRVRNANGRESTKHPKGIYAIRIMIRMVEGEKESCDI